MARVFIIFWVVLVLSGIVLEEAGAVFPPSSQEQTEKRTGSNVMPASPLVFPEETRKAEERAQWWEAQHKRWIAPLGGITDGIIGIVVALVHAIWWFIWLWWVWLIIIPIVLIVLAARAPQVIGIIFAGIWQGWSTFSKKKKNP